MSCQVYIRILTVMSSINIAKLLKVGPIKFASELTDDSLGDHLQHLSSNYYNGVALVDDTVFDTLQDILKERNPTHPALDAIGAPIGDTNEQFSSELILVEGPTITNPKHRAKVDLPYWMGSMDKVKPGTKPLSNWLGKFPGEKVISDKLDGISALLIYRKGMTSTDLEISLYTRGDGAVGQDISCLLPYLNLPKITNHSDNGNNKDSIVLAVRAELIMSKENFKQFANVVPNARNLVSGIVNSKTIKTQLVGLIDFITYECINKELRASEQFALLKNLGFKVADHTVSDKVDGSWLTKHFTERKAKSLWEIDGIIICDNNLHPRNTSKNPKYAVAFKMQIDNAVETEVLEVNWDVSADGYLFPVVKVKPVFVCGVNIQNCSGKNAKYIVDNCIGPGAIVKITRDGDVIPGIHSIVKGIPNPMSALPDPKKTSTYHWTASGVDIVLDVKENNPAVILKCIIHFFKTLGVTGFDEGMITKCFNSNKLNTIQKILTATVNDFMDLPGVKITMATKIHKAIADASVKPDLATVMIASNKFGRGYGERKTKLLLSHIPNILDYDASTGVAIDAVTAKICSIDGFATITAEQFSYNLQFFKDFLKTLPEYFQKNIVYPNNTKTLNTSNNSVDTATTASTNNATTKRFQNKTVVFTGVRNKDWEKIIEDEGGKIGSSVSSNTTFLVIKDHSFTSTKITKAHSLNIKVLSMDEFSQMFGLSL